MKNLHSAIFFPGNSCNEESWRKRFENIKLIKIEMKYQIKKIDEKERMSLYINEYTPK